MEMYDHNFGSGFGRGYLNLQGTLWNSIRHYLLPEEINLVVELSSSIQNKEVREIPEPLLSVVILYIIHSRSLDECKVLFEGFQNKDSTSFIDAIKSLVRFDLIEATPEKQMWLTIKEQEDNWNKLSHERLRIYNEIILKTYARYYEQYKSEYGFTYKSPNSDKDSNYGSFLIDISNKLNNEGIEFDLKHPWSKLYENYDNKIHKKKFQESLTPTIYSPNVSKILKDLLQQKELKDLYYELLTKYELKRFFLLGGITPEILLLDYVKVYGYEFLRNHMSEKKWEEFSKDLEYYLNGTYGIQNDWNYKYFTKYKEQDVYLIGLIQENQEYHQIQELNKNENLKELWKKRGLNFDIERIKQIYHSPILTTMVDDFQVHEFIRDKEVYYEYIKSFAGPENEIRTLLGFKEIGEGWVSETKLFYLIKEKFKSHRIIQHGKPKWLGKQHLDIFIPDLNIGIEYQGKQHTMPLEIFGGMSSFEENVKRDKRKKGLCEQNNCKLFEVFPEDNIYSFIDTLEEYIGNVGSVTE